MLENEKKETESGFFAMTTEELYVINGGLGESNNSTSSTSKSSSDAGTCGVIYRPTSK